MFVLIILALVLLFLIVVSFAACKKLLFPKTKIPEVYYETGLSDAGLSPEDYEKGFNKEDFTVESSFGYPLSCTLIPKKEGTSFKDGRERVVVIVHGWTMCKYASLKYVSLFRSFGFNCVIYDHRNHGHSGKKITSMGWYESIDLKTVCDWVFKRFPDNPIVGTHGESMGAATVLMNSSQDDRLSFVIEDCGYSSLFSQTRNAFKDTLHLPFGPFKPFTNLIMKLLTGAWMSQIEPKERVSQCPKDLPMMFIHGDNDTFVMTNEVNYNFEKKQGIKTKKLYEGAKHAESILVQPEQYKNDVEFFLKENGLI